jgi:surface antigen
MQSGQWHQWEAIANFFNGPFHYLGNIWSSVVAFFSGIGSTIWNAITSIRLPSLPKLVLPSISGAAIIGGITCIIPEWEWNPPEWWPFNKNTESVSGSGGGSWGGEDGGNAGNSGNSSASSGDGSSSQATNDKPYPQPPTSPKLTEVTGTPSSYTCATYARDRRPDLGSTQSNNEDFADGAAANYISKFEDTAFQIDDSGENLTDIVGPGYALVWEPDHPGANDTYGHVAIIEEVYADHVVISEASRVNGVYQIRNRSISIDQLNNDLVWLIP